MKKFFIYAMALAGSIGVNNQVHAQRGFSVSVKATPQFSFLQNKNDNDNNSYSRDATFKSNFGVGGAYNFNGSIEWGWMSCILCKVRSIL